MRNKILCKQKNLNKRKDDKSYRSLICLFNMTWSLLTSILKNNVIFKRKKIYALFIFNNLEIEKRKVIFFGKYFFT